MKQINMARNKESLVVANTKYAFAFQWITGSLDVYFYQTPNELRQGLENHHLYEDPAESSGRIVWCTNTTMLERVRGHAT